MSVREHPGTQLNSFFDTTAVASCIASWLPAARWYAAKGLPLEQITIEDLLVIPRAQQPTALAIVSIAQQNTPDHSSAYLIPLSAEANELSEHVGLYDAALSPTFAAWLIGLAFEQRSESARVGSFVGHATACSLQECIPANCLPEITLLGGDASNTSLAVRWGECRLIVKLLRRCRAGIQPEVDIGLFLAEQTDWQGTPRLMGWVEYVAHDDAHSATVIATVHEFFDGCVSAWDRLADLLSVGVLATSQDGIAIATPQVVSLVESLGRTSGQMHRALAARSDIPAFAPQAESALARQLTASHMEEQARQIFASAAAQLSQLPIPIATRLRDCIANSERLIQRLQHYAAFQSSALVLRVHGDYHLGQVLVTPGDARLFVIDFEGEPSRSIQERCAQKSVLKDVAGMCRSFDYLLRFVAKQAGHAYSPQDLLFLEQCFLSGYREIAIGQPWWPSDPQEVASLLAIYKLDKALYELAYELHNRPEWIDVPLAAIESLGA